MSDKRKETLKSVVDNIFKNFEETAKKNERVRKQKEEEKNDEFERAVNHAMADVDDFHSAYMNFLDEIEHLKITDYFAEPLALLSANGQFMELVVKGRFDDINDTIKDGKVDDLEGFRAKVLAEVFKYYEGDAPF